MNRATILLADDEATLRENLAEVISEDSECDVIVCADGTEALKALRHHHVDALITDLRMPGITGMDLIDEALEIAPEIAIIVITAFGEIDTAVEAMKKGVGDYICKPLMLEDVVFRLKRLLAHKTTAKENVLLRKQIRETVDPVATLGESGSIRSIRSQIDELGRITEPVLIIGELGTRKKDIARAIHRAQGRPGRPFVSADCSEPIKGHATIAPDGVRKWSLKPGQSGRPACFEAAEGGTLFFGEITELPLTVQIELLRTIKDSAPGNGKTKSGGTRVIVASRYDLGARVHEGTFDQELYCRLETVQLRVPPLRDRAEDIETVSKYIMGRFSDDLNMRGCKLSLAATEALAHYVWPGNLLELEAVLRRAMLLADGEIVDVDHLGLSSGGGRRTLFGASDLSSAIREFEREHISNVLASVGGNKIEAAQVLDIGLSSLYRKLDGLKEVHSHKTEGFAS